MMQFEPPDAIRQIVVVGLGGTGSQLARSIARIVFDMQQHNLQIPSVLFVDPDQVEPRNVGRQMFTPADVDQHKAELLARRFNAALGLQIAWSNMLFDPQAHIPQRTTLLVGCVDNHSARRKLAQAYAIWLDCGNHKDSGQVILGTTSDPGRVWSEVHSGRKVIHALPNAALIFPELLEPEETAGLDANASCAELVEARVQALLVNDAIALTAANYIYRLLYRKPLTLFMSWVSLEAIRPVAIGKEEMEPYLNRIQQGDVMQPAA